MNQLKIKSLLARSFYNRALPLIDQFGPENEDDRSNLLLEFYKVLENIGAASDELAELDQKIIESVRNIQTDPERNQETAHYLRVNVSHLSDLDALEKIKSISEADVREDSLFHWGKGRVQNPIDDPDTFHFLEDAFEEIDDLGRYEELTGDLFFAVRKIKDRIDYPDLLVFEKLETPSAQIAVLLRLYNEKINDRADPCELMNLIGRLKAILKLNPDLSSGGISILTGISTIPNDLFDLFDWNSLTENISDPETKGLLISALIRDYCFKHDQKRDETLLDLVRKQETDLPGDLKIPPALIKACFLSGRRQEGIDLVRKFLRRIRQESDCIRIYYYLELYRIHEAAGENKAAKQLLDLAEKTALDLDLNDAKSLYLTEIIRTKISQTKENPDILARLLDQADTIPGPFYRFPLKLTLRIRQDLLEPFACEEDLVQDLEKKTFSDLSEFNEFQDQAYLLSVLANNGIS